MRAADSVGSRMTSASPGWMSAGGWVALRGTPELNPMSFVGLVCPLHDETDEQLVGRFGDCPNYALGTSFQSLTTDASMTRAYFDSSSNSPSPRTYGTPGAS
jgi:hypothetical protein